MAVFNGSSFPIDFQRRLYIYLLIRYIHLSCNIDRNFNPLLTMQQIFYYLNRGLVKGGNQLDRIYYMIIILLICGLNKANYTHE